MAQLPALTLTTDANMANLRASNPLPAIPWPAGPSSLLNLPTYPSAAATALPLQQSAAPPSETGQTLPESQMEDAETARKEEESIEIKSNTPISP